ncbi:MAG: phosphoribosylformylglycinamidine cyclo-ligase [Alphaproteobacteria bacterium]|nr:phosphoribosylformylglycinamidine cyclo-ligase [Alphaproteobacteria bacterium]MCB9698252.1 phosphoribosylformylglycinamidine cyclo-ligase [Alphaproteobacteria bacterium]
MQRDAYREAGVDVDAGDSLVERIKPWAARTMRDGVIGGLGGFGGLFGLKGYEDPVLVSGTDGVGTKLLVAQALGRHDTIGIDLVAMCVNDIAVSGAEPLFFLDYFATGKLDVDVAERVVAGIARGCERSGCALLGGETAEMPGMYAPGHYDLAGFAVGVVERSKILDGASIRPGHQLVGLPSSGLHSNGYSLVRKLLLTEDADLSADPGGLGRPLGDELLEPTRLYPRLLLGIRDAWPLGGAAHITGGGLPGNVPRMLSDGLAARMWRGSWPVPPIFGLLQQRGELTEQEMVRTFNCGLGMVLAIEAEQAEALAEATGGFVVGEIVERGEGQDWELVS